MTSALARLALACGLIAAAGCGDDGDEVTTSGDVLELTYTIHDDLTRDEVDELTSILENRLAALGVDDPSITVDGDEVRIELEPGAVQADEITEIVGTEAALTFRPVLLAVPRTGEVDEELPLTPADADLPESTVVLDDPEELRYQLGPAEASGSIIEDAVAQLDPNGSWLIALTLTADGIDDFNILAATCAPPSATCPTGQLAIVLDSVVQSAPMVQEASFERDAITISGAFTEEEAKDLALVLRYGALPARLTPTSSSGAG